MESLFKMRQILRMILLIYLAVEAGEDIRKKTVSVKWAVCFAVPVIVLQVFPGGETDDGGTLANVAALANGILPGILLMATAGITGQAVGYGDGLVLAVCGLVVKAEGSVGILLYGLFLSAAAALYLLTVKKAGRKREIPFVPCLLGGYVIWLCFGG